MKILIIEDEKELMQSMAEYLLSENYLCEFASNCNEALDKILNYDYDCILLDLTLPDGNGLRILEELKTLNKQDGVIIISAKNSLEDKIKGLQIGADDYLAKPFHLSELSARIQSLIRRRKFVGANQFNEHELLIDITAKSIYVNKTSLNITRKEYNLLLFLISNKNKVISKGALAEHLSGDIADMLNNHDFVYAHIKNLKKKLSEAGCKDYIKTIYGMGYKWE